MCQEKKLAEDSTALKIARMQQFTDSKNIQKKKKERLITAASNSYINSKNKQKEQIEKQQLKN